MFLSDRFHARIACIDCFVPSFPYPSHQFKQQKNDESDSPFPITIPLAEFIPLYVCKNPMTRSDQLRPKHNLRSSAVRMRNDICLSAIHIAYEFTCYYLRWRTRTI